MHGFTRGSLFTSDYQQHLIIVWDACCQKVGTSQGKVEGRTSPCSTGVPRGVASPGWQRHRPSPSALQNQQGSLQALYNRFRDVLGGVFREVQMLACSFFATTQPLRLSYGVCRTADACPAPSSEEADCYTMAQHQQLTCRENPGVRWSTAPPSLDQPILPRYGPCCLIQTGHASSMIHTEGWPWALKSAVLMEW